MSASHAAVGQRVLDNIDFVRALCRTKSSKKVSRSLANATDEQLLTLVEIALNILRSRFPLKSSQIRKLLPYADFVRKLSRCRSSKTARQIVQKGGNPLLSALLIPIAVEVGRHLLQSRDDDGKENAAGS